MVNHGSSPPNLGLKETTPELGETRLNRDTFKQYHNNKNQHEYHSLTTHLQSMLTQPLTTLYIESQNNTPKPRLYTKIHPLNQIEG